MFVFVVIEFVCANGIVGADHESDPLASDPFHTLVRPFDGTIHIRGNVQITRRDVEIVFGPLLWSQADTFEISKQGQAGRHAKYFRVHAKSTGKSRLQRMDFRDGMQKGLSGVAGKSWNKAGNDKYSGVQECAQCV